MSPKKKARRFTNPFRKKLFGRIAIFLLSVLFLEFIVYFGSNIILSDYIRRKINEASDGVYRVDFNRINISLLRRGFFLDGIVMKPTGPGTQKKDQVVFDFTLAKVSFTGLWYDFGDKELFLSNIYLDNPDFRIRLPDTDPQDDQNILQGTSSIKLLENEIRKSIQDIKLARLYIGQIEIDHSNLLFANFLSQNTLTSENTSVIVKEINWATEEVWDTPFNAKGFEFRLDNVAYPTADGVHYLHASKVRVSSIDREVDLKGFSIKPNLDKESRVYYDLSLDELRVGDVDLNKAFMTSVLEINELILENPDIRVRLNPQVQSEKAPTGNLNELIKGILKSVSIREFVINKANFTKSELGDTLKNRIELENLGFRLAQFYISQEEELKQEQFFYGQDASMQIGKSRIYLGDGVHVLQGEQVEVSSFSNELLVKNLTVMPLYNQINSKKINRVIRLNLPDFALKGAALKKFYNEGRLEVDYALIRKPNIQIIEKKARSAPSQQGFDKINLPGLVAEFVHEVYVKDFDLQDGTVQFEDERGRKSSNVEFEKFSVRLDRLWVKPDPTLALQKQLQVEGVLLTLDQYRVKLRDDLHVILADQLLIDSKRSLVDIKNLIIKPEDDSKAQDPSRKAISVNLSVPTFRAEGIDVKAAFFNQRMEIKKILMPSPEFAIFDHRAKKAPSNTNALASSGKIRSLLLSHFGMIKVDSVSIDNGKIEYQRISNGKKTSFKENDFSLSLINLKLEEEHQDSTERTLFSEEIDLVLNNYSSSLAGGKYFARSNKVSYNSAGGSLRFEDLHLIPGRSFDSRMSLRLNFPLATLSGVDIEEFLFKNVLNLDKLEIEKGVIDIGIDQEVSSDTQQLFSNRQGNRLDLINIDTLLTRQSSLRLNYLGKEGRGRVIETGFELLVRDFYLDSQSVSQKKVRQSYSSIRLALKDFVFTLPDSVHTLRFANVQLEDNKEELVFSGLKISSDKTAKDSNTLFIQAKVDQVSIRNNSLNDILETGRFDLNEITLHEPDIYVHIPQQMARSTKSPASKKDRLIKSIWIHSIAMENAKIKVDRADKPQQSGLNFRNLSFKTGNLNINLMSSNQSPILRKLLENTMDFGLTDYEIILPDSLYYLRLGKATFQDGVLNVENLSYRPRYGNYELLRKLPYQSDAVNLKVSRITLRDFEPLVYLKKNKLKAKDLLIEQVDVDLFRDKRRPENKNLIKPMPQYLMENSNINAEFDSFRIRDATVRYFEFAEKGTMPGMISFDDMRLDMGPFVLAKDSSSYPLNQTKLEIEAKIMNTGHVRLEALMHFQHKYPMDIRVEMDRFEFKETNDFLAKTMFAKATRGMVTDGNWSFTLNEDYAIGRMKLKYDNLQIQLLDSLTLEPGQGKLKVYSFLANLLAKNSNPRGIFKKTVSRNIYQERNKSKFVFNAWWKATLSGIRATFGFGRAQIPKGIEKPDHQ